MKFLVTAAIALACTVLVRADEQQRPKLHIFGGPAKFAPHGNATAKKNDTSGKPSESFQPFQFPQFKTNPLCGPCVGFVDGVLANVRNNAKNVLKAVDGPKKFCEHIQSLPFYDYPVCRMMIEKIAPTIEDLFKLNNLSGAQICRQFFGCPSSEIQRNGPLGSAKFADDFYEWEHTLTASDYNLPKLPKLPQAVTQAISELKCDGCHVVLKYVEASLNNSAVRQWALSELEQVCYVLPAVAQQNCRDILVERGTHLLDEAAKLLQPGSFCAKVKFCPTETIKPTLYQQAENERALLPPGALCGPCKWAVDEAVKVANSHSKTAVEFFGKICTAVKPHSPQLAITCDLALAQFGEQIIAQFLAKVESHKACSKARMCPVSQDKSFDERLDLKDIACEGCELLFNFATLELADSNFQSIVADISVTICSVVPANLYGSCQTMVEQYMPKILQTVAALVKPRTICQKIHFCKAQNQTAAFLNLIETNQKALLPANTLCAPCQWAFRHVQPLVDKSLTSIVNLISPSVCNVLPAEGILRAHCKEILEAYGELVGRIVLQKIERNPPCHRMGFCKDSQQQQQAVQVHEQEQVQESDRAFQINMLPDFCAICKATLGKAYDQVPVVEGKLEQAVEPLCDSLTDPQAKDKCTKMADKFISDTATTVQQALNPEKTCKALKLCN
jgi:hypothetical protein